MDEWPKNKGICSRLFQECEVKVQSEQDAVATGIAVDLPTPSTSAVSYKSIPIKDMLMGLLTYKPHCSVMIFGNINKPIFFFVFFHNKITS